MFMVDAKPAEDWALGGGGPSGGGEWGGMRLGIAMLPAAGQDRLHLALALDRDRAAARR